ncbi:MAG: hypothetical protein JWO98_150 [Frankiales bacterium]|nr:hypothetical protein [Frankiales bacterium]
MSNRHTVRITANGPHATEVSIDGTDIRNALTGLTLRMGVGDIPRMTVDLLLLDVTELQDAEAQVLIPDATVEALVALGWTPPVDPAPADTKE